jgi:ubiquinone/menaquinone biosynthesis C-methylase UbiE
MSRSYYDEEAARYDRSRGGDARAGSAAEAIGSLLPRSAGVVLDVAGGTGIVGASVRGHRVISMDSSMGMSRVAVTRLPGRVSQADATALPVMDAVVDAVTIVWLLHLLDETRSAEVLAEAARVLRPGGTLITTVHKAESHYATDDDVADVLLPIWHSIAPSPTDATDRIAELAATHGLAVTGRSSFTGTSQGRSPSQWRRYLAGADNGWRNSTDVPSVTRHLAALPDQDRQRNDPSFQLVALTQK